MRKIAGLGGKHQQVPMLGHQAIPQQTRPRHPPCALGQEIDKCVVVRCVAGKGASAPGHDSWHVERFPPARRVRFLASCECSDPAGNPSMWAVPFSSALPCEGAHRRCQPLPLPVFHEKARGRVISCGTAASAVIRNPQPRAAVPQSTLTPTLSRSTAEYRERGQRRPIATIERHTRSVNIQSRELPRRTGDMVR